MSRVPAPGATNGLARPSGRWAGDGTARVGYARGVKRDAAILIGLLSTAACNSATHNSNGVAPEAPKRAEATAPAGAPSEPMADLPAPKPADPRESIIARGVLELLEREHLHGKRIDDAVSLKAFDRFIERLDPGKLFLTKPQVAALRARADKMDDELRSGELQLARTGAALIAQQRAKVAKMVEERLGKPFDFSKVESYESDPDKREFSVNDAALADRWRKSLKVQVLERTARMQTAAEDAAKVDKEAKDKGKTAPKREPIPETFEGREEKARKDLATTYAGRFVRLAKQEPLEAVETFVNAVAGVFDPHTMYMAPADQANFDIQMSGSLEGIGAVLSEDDHYINVREIVPGGAAWRQGDLEAGDLILAVQQQDKKPVDVADMRLNDVVKMIRGPKGTLVTLTVKKPDESVAAVEIKRDVIVVEASYARGALLQLKPETKPVGYIYLPSFYGNTRARKGQTPERDATGDVRALLERFRKDSVGGVILDLRGNGGGLLTHATDITGLFVEKGPVVQARSSSGRIQVLEDDDPSLVYDGEVVVLVDRFSASASEILAGALQDYGRALIVGTGPTHGKGTVQMLADFDRMLGQRGKPLGVLKLTVQQFFLVDGESTQRRGVQPDVVLPDPASFVESGERYLDNAIPWSSVKPLPHSPWKRSSWQRDSLLQQSQQRQSQMPVFASITARGKHLQSRQDDTLVPLQREAWDKKRKADKEQLDKLDPKLEEGEARFDVKVVNYGPSKPTASGEVRKDTGERIKKWREQLAHDPWLQEALHIMQTMTVAK